MITAIDTNVIVGLWNPDDDLNSAARETLDAAFADGRLIICGAVYGELVACPGRTEEFIDEFLGAADIAVDWSSTQAVWRTAGASFQKYAHKRRRQGSGQSRRILTDFYIGAHALCSSHRLLTLDDGIYKTAFPKLQIFRV